jgi:hypothetical protein
MATAVVSGLVAVMIEANDYATQQRHTDLTMKLKKAYVAPPALTPNALKAMLQYSATPLSDERGAKYNALTQGTGEVDGLGAIALAYYADTSKSVGTGWLTAPVVAATKFGIESDDWAQNIVWGTVVISGSGLIDVNQSAWSQSTTWGAGELDNIVSGAAEDGDAANIVWGTSVTLPDVAWSGNVIEGNNIVWGTSLTDWALNIVWGTSIGVLQGENIVWGTSDQDGDNIVWGTMTDGDGDNIVWGTVDYGDFVSGSAAKVLGYVLTGGAL